MKVFNYYNITDFNYDSLDDGTIKDQVGQTEEKHINDCLSLCLLNLPRLSEVQHSQKLDFYTLYTRLYFLYTFNRKTLVKLRISNYKLKIET